MSEGPGLIILFGSGEIAPGAQRTYDWAFKRLSPPIRVAVLETPAGFELNSDQVAGRVADYIRHRLQNYNPQVAVIPARQRGTPFSPDNPDILAPMRKANVIFAGPGSPTYAIRQLRDSLAWHILTARHRLGATIILASSAVIALSVLALPVYEIYKVGEDIHWKPGLDFFGPYGLSLVFVSHWDNREGGADLDTSRCFMGQSRFAKLLTLLPAGMTVVGIDEHTALTMDLIAGRCQVMGRSGVTLIKEGQEQRFERGQSFAITELGPFHLPEPQIGLPAEVWQSALQDQVEIENVTEPPLEVMTLVEKRENARARRNWAEADALRDQIAVLGWRILDTPQGPKLEPLPKKA